MGLFDGARGVLRNEAGMASAACGLACVLTAMSGMRLNTIDGIYPVDISLIVRHIIGAVAALGVFLACRRNRGRGVLLGTSSRRVFLLSACFSAVLLMRYSPYLFIAELPGLSLAGKLLEEFFGILLILTWAERVLSFGLGRTVTLFGAAVTACALLQLLLSFFQRVPCMFALVVLPLVSAGLFRSHVAARTASDARPDDESLPLDATSVPCLALYVAFLLCFVFITGQVLHPTLGIQQQNLSSQLSIALGNGAAGLCILLVAERVDALRAQPRLAFAVYFLAMFALTTIAFALMSYLNSVSVTAYLALASVGTQLAMLLVWVLPFARLRPGWTPFAVLALGYACNQAARTVSTIAMYAANGNPAFPSGVVAGVALALAFAVCVAFIVRVPDAPAAMPAQGLAQAVGDKAASPANACADVRPTPFREAIAAMVGDYGLTAQEGRVLDLCSKGKNARNVADEMGVSLNTAKSHMRTLYAKLAVHSQQELIKLVDAAVDEARRGRRG